MRKITIYLSNLNAIIFFVGFPAFTTLFYGVDIGFRDTSSLTIGYRAFTLILSLLVVLLNGSFPKLSINGKLFILLWCVYLCRVLFDLYFRDGSHYFSNNQKLIHTSDSIVTCFLPLMALLYSFRVLNWEKIFYWILISLFFLTIFGLSGYTGDYQRFRLNAAQNELSFGFYSAATFLAGLTVYRTVKKTIAYRNFVSIFLMIVGFVGVMVAGSRGPLFALMFVIMLTYFLKRSVVFVVLVIAFFVGFMYFESYILEILHDTFPVIFDRTQSTLVNGDMSEREYIFIDAISQIKSHPIFGDWHLLYIENGIGNGAHNLILSTMMSVGVFFGAIIIYLYIYFLKLSVNLISSRSLFSFIGFISLLSIGYSLTTGGDLVYKDTFNFSFGLLIITTVRESNLK